MAESVKRRVAAARLAVAFVAAGTIAGATAWAQAAPPPVATSSASDAAGKIKITGDNVIDGTLSLQDFHRGEVVSMKQFQKLDAAFNHFKKATSRELGHIKGEISSIKGELVSGYVKRSDLDGYIKMSDADARYIKLTDAVVRGRGSVLTASRSFTGAVKEGLVEVPNMFTVDAQGPVITITNTSGGNLAVSRCSNGVGGFNGDGVIGPGGKLTCDGSNGDAQALQIVAAGAGGGPQVATLNFTAIALQGAYQDTVQILIGL